MKEKHQMNLLELWKNCSEDPPSGTDAIIESVKTLLKSTNDGYNRVAESMMHEYCVFSMVMGSFPPWTAPDTTKGSEELENNTNVIMINGINNGFSRVYFGSDGGKYAEYVIECDNGKHSQEVKFAVGYYMSQDSDNLIHVSPYVVCYNVSSSVWSLDDDSYVKVIIGVDLFMEFETDSPVDVPDTGNQIERDGHYQHTTSGKILRTFNSYKSGADLNSGYHEIYDHAINDNDHHYYLVANNNTILYNYTESARGQVDDDYYYFGNKGGLPSVKFSFVVTNFQLHTYIE